MSRRLPSIMRRIAPVGWSGLKDAAGLAWPGMGSFQFWLLAGLFVLVFLAGGGARGDIGSLMLLRPLAILALGIGFMSISWQQVHAYRLLFAFAAASLALVLLQLVPLPPALVYALSGRGIIADIDRVAGLQGTWRPMTMTPAATRNALWALMPPFAVLVLAAQLSVRERAGMLNIVLVLGFASAFLALLQVLGDPKGPLYFYRITNNGSAVGLFANRNHHAMLLASMISMLAVWVRLHPEHRRQTRSWQCPFLASAVLAGLFLVPLILVAGSRSGMFIALLALASLLLFIKRSRRARSASGATAATAKVPWFARAIPWLLVVGIAALVVLTIWMDRAVAVNRLLASNPAEDMRLKILPTLRAMIGNYFPWGSGFGSFVQVYQLHEPDALLSPTYMNHAHNDWLELALTGGVPALLIAACAIGAWLVRAVRAAVSRSAPGGEPLARLGLVIMLLFALASLSDYPLRVPSLACLFVLAAVWAAAPGEVDDAARLKAIDHLSISGRNIRCV